MTDKTSINREELAKTAALVRPALAVQAYLPALTHIRFSKGWATAYNDISAIMVRSTLDAERCIPGDLLIRALGSFGGETLLLQEGKGTTLVLKSGRSMITLPTLEVKDFPFALPDDANASEIPLTADMLKGIQRCLISVGNDPTKPASMGVTMDADDSKRAVLFSTDNATMSRYQTDSKIKLPAEAPVILPTFFCEQIVSLAKAYPEASLTLVLLNGALLVEFGKEARLFTKTLVDLQPLDFQRVMNKQCNLARLSDVLAEIPDTFDAALGRALLVLGGEVDKATCFESGRGAFMMESSCAMGVAEDRCEFKTSDPDMSAFFADPALVARAAKVAAQMGFLPTAIVLADADAKFVHLVAHCHDPKAKK